MASSRAVSVPSFSALFAFPKAPPRFRAFTHSCLGTMPRLCAATQGRCAMRQTWFLVHAMKFHPCRAMVRGTFIPILAPCRSHVKRSSRRARSAGETGMHKPQGGLAVFLGHVCGPWPPCLRRFVAPHRLFSTRSGRPSSQPTKPIFQVMATDAPLLPPNRFDGDRSKPAFVPG